MELSILYFNNPPVFLCDGNEKIYDINDVIADGFDINNIVLALKRKFYLFTDIIKTLKPRRSLSLGLTYNGANYSYSSIFKKVKSYSDLIVEDPQLIAAYEEFLKTTDFDQIMFMASVFMASDDPQATDNDLLIIRSELDLTEIDYPNILRFSFMYKGKVYWISGMPDEPHVYMNFKIYQIGPIGSFEIPIKGWDYKKVIQKIIAIIK